MTHPVSGTLKLSDCGWSVCLTESPCRIIDQLPRITVTKRQTMYRFCAQMAMLSVKMGPSITSTSPSSTHVLMDKLMLARPTAASPAIWLKVNMAWQFIFLAATASTLHLDSPKPATYSVASNEMILETCELCYLYAERIYIHSDQSEQQ